MIDYHLCGRVCSKCGEFKTWLDFGKDIKSFTGFRGTCLSCRKEENIRDREKNRARSKKYYYDHREEKLEYAKEYRETHKDEIAECQKEYAIEKKDELREYKKEYNRKNRKILAVKSKIYRDSPAKYSIFKDALSEFEAPIDGGDDILLVKCATCREYFSPTYQEASHRRKVLRGDGLGECRLYCSDSCKEACDVFDRNKYPKGFKKSRKRECLPEIRKMVLERDNYTCQYCHNKFDEKDLEAHHENPVACSPMEQADICDIKTACKWCHKDKHKEGTGMGYGELAKTALINEEIIETLKGATP